jgi:hypothetical protein
MFFSVFGLSLNKVLKQDVFDVVGYMKEKEFMEVKAIEEKTKGR